ncbi:MAG: phosphate ABC transporter permease subunit PstC [Candidatus Zixiibacteriota bacterium]
MAKYFIGAVATFSILMLFAITIMLFVNAFPFFGFDETSVKEFFTGTHWRPDMDNYGFLPLLWGTLLVTFIAMLFAVPIGLASAMYLHSVAPFALRETLKPMMEILGSVPSVVYGLFGMTILAPFVQKILDLTIGQCAAVAGITLGVMVIPLVISISEDALASVPKELSEAALSLGATKWETLVSVVIPAAKSGIWAALLLSFGRAIGETMTVLMVAGGAAQIAFSPFDPVRPMTAAIAAEMGETPAGSPHFHALFLVATVLYLITLALNLIANKYAQRPN